MCAAGALRGSPASMTMTDRRCRPSCRAAARPAAEPPMTATSQWRSTVWGVCVAHGDDDTVSSRYVQVALQYSQDGGERRWPSTTRSSRWCAPGCAACAPRSGLSLDELAARTNLSAVHDQPGRDRQADDQPRRPAAAGAGAPGRPRLAARRAQRRRRGHPARRRAAPAAHDLDAEPADRQHDRDQDAARADRGRRRAAGAPRSRLVLRHRGPGAAARSASARSSSRPARRPSSPP